MRVRDLHPWENLTPREARDLQSALRGSLVLEGALPPLRWVAGADGSYPRRAMPARGAVVCLTAPDLEIAEQRLTAVAVAYPYIPGLLSFREAPVLLPAFAALETTPDVVLFDGHGLAHPRRFGLACHLGLVLDLPSIGCAKSLLVGQHGPLGEEVGSVATIIDRGEVVGAAVRTRAGARPVYVSQGHRISLDAAIEVVLACCRGHRLPEPSRIADRALRIAD